MGQVQSQKGRQREKTELVQQEFEPAQKGKRIAEWLGQSWA